MLRSQSLLAHEPISVASGTAPSSSTYLSQQIPVSKNVVGYILHVLIAVAPTGTTPGLVVELDTTTTYGGGSFARLGGAISALTAVGDTAIPYYTSSTQGAIPANTTFVQVKAVLANADNVFPDVSIDLIELF